MKITVGLTGPTGAGKGEVCNLFREHGYFVIDADKVAHLCTEKGSPLLDSLAEKFGGDIIKPDGTLDRKLLASRAFTDPAKTALLNAITLPYISELIKNMVAQTDKEYIVIDAPTLFESGLDSMCTHCVCVTADADLRFERILKRDGLTVKQAQDRFAAQKPDDFYIDKCDFFIYNNSDISALGTQVYDIVKQIGGALN